MSIRGARVAGSFYPGEKKELKGMVKGFLGKVPDQEIDGEVKGIIVPHAGYAYSGQVAAYGFSVLKGLGKERIILLGPSHFAAFSGIVGDVNDYWETPLGRVKTIKNHFPKLEQAHSQEHCLEVQVPFLQEVLNDFEIMPLVSGDVYPKDITDLITKVLGGGILIISSDLSHYHDYDTAVERDSSLIFNIENLDYNNVQKGEACGINPILTAIDIANKLKWKCKLLEYKNSGDVSGMKSEVVGYASFCLFA